MTRNSTSPILTLSCPDRYGIVAEVAAFLSAQGCNIEHSAQDADHDTGLFFMRVEFSLATGSLKSIEEKFQPIAKRFEMDARVYDGATPVRTIIMASKTDHCLADILHRVQRGEINLDIRGVVSNHQTCARLAAHYGAPYLHLPVTNETRKTQEAEVLSFIDGEDIELVVLARYMQILSPDACERLAGRAINIHHSFLPGFKGARPYHRAYERGVKLIGATAHFVTADLDEGPIIEQETERVDFAKSADDFIRIGRDVERRTLARAVRWYSERRILLNGVKTVIFQ